MSTTTTKILIIIAAADAAVAVVVVLLPPVSFMLMLTPTATGMLLISKLSRMPSSVGDAQRGNLRHRPESRSRRRACGTPYRRANKLHSEPDPTQTN